MRRRRRRTAAVPLAALLAAAVLAAGCGGERDGSGGGDSDGGRLTIGTGNTTGVYYVLGGGYATLVGDTLSGYRVTPEVTGGPKENIDRVAEGEDDLGLCSLSWATDAIKGQGAFSSPQPIRALSRLYLNYTHVVVRSGIDSLAQLRGKRISTGSPGATGELGAARLLAAAGLDVEKDTRRQKISLNESIQEMKDGELDAIFWSGGLPTSGIQDLTRTLGGKVRLLDLGRYVHALQAEYPDIYEATTIGPEVYQQPAPVRTVAEPNLLIVNQSMDRTLAADLTGVLLDNLPALAQVHPEGRNITREKAPQTQPVPLHPGAEQYYRDNP
jgi:TRAP transporter TAXI family solute receptor